MSFNPKDFYEKGSNKIIRTGLKLFLDAGNRSSYGGSGTTWTDISGNGYNGTLTNGPTYSSGNGGSIVFDGTNDYIGGTGIDDARISLSGASATTTTLWIKRNTISTAQQVFLFYSNAFANAIFYFAFNTTNTLQAGCRSANETASIRITTSTYTSTTDWLHVGIVANYSANTITIYVNGVAQATTGAAVSFSQTTLASGTTTGSNRIGMADAGGNFNGSIAQVLQYNRALSATEVSLNFNYQKNKYGL